MENISTYLEEALLNHVMRNIEYTRPTTVYCGLADDVAVDAELEAGTLTNEITAYTGDRKAITFGAPTQESDKATIKNTAALEFELMPAVTVKYAIVCDAATVGNILYWMPLTAEKTCNPGDTFRLPIDALVLNLA
ncbi:hypothetical protein ES703_110495 [subsurface metagenome]